MKTKGSKKRIILSCFVVISLNTIQKQILQRFNFGIIACSFPSLLDTFHTNYLNLNRAIKYNHECCYAK